jgi:hypothetical protein
MADSCISKSMVSSFIISSSNFLNKAMSLIMTKDDLFSFTDAKRMVKTSSFLKPWRVAFSYLGEEGSARLFQTAVNLAFTFYIYGFASWTLYLFTTVSGIKTLQKVLLKNPIYSVPFFLSFYFKMLSGRDIQSIETVENIFGVKGLYVSFWDAIRAGNSSTLAKLVFSSSNYLLAKMNINAELSERVAEDISIQIIATLSTLTVFNKIQSLFSGEPTESMVAAETDPAENMACYLTLRDDINYDDSDFVDFYKKISQDGYVRDLKKLIKSELNTTNKTRVNAELSRRLEKTDDNGIPLCLDGCTTRSKTKSGNICESECGKSLILGNDWCYINKASISNPKLVGKKYGKKHWEECDPKKTTQKPVCFTGRKYKPCVKK